MYTPPEEAVSSLAESMANVSISDVVKLILMEKVNHYQILTDVVKSLSLQGWLNMGDTCLAHHVYLIGSSGAKGASSGDFAKYLKTNAAKNYTEAVVSGLGGVAKADVYVLKQMRW